jgi:hypothetical protein
MSSIQDFLNTLFDDEDKVFVGPDLYSGSVVRKKDVSSGQFFCLNACEGGRKKCDIKKFRNFLIEIDEIPGTKEPMPHKEQVLLIHQKYKVPYSTVVNSGNKSIHFIISLEEPLDNVEEYQFIAAWIKNIVVEADESVLIPEKLSRFFGGINTKTQKEQKGYISKKGRVSNARFLEWLGSYPEYKPVTPEAKTTRPQHLSHNREGILPIVHWYVTEYLKRPYNNIRGHYQCPICSLEGCDTSRDNMYVSGPQMKFHCFAVKEHNQLIFREMRSLYYKHRNARHEI